MYDLDLFEKASVTSAGEPTFSEPAAEPVEFFVSTLSNPNSSSPVIGSSGDDCPVELNLMETRLGPLTYWFSKLLVVLPIALGIFGNLIVYKIMKHPGFTNKTFSYFLRVLALVDSLNLLSYLFLHVNDVVIRLSDGRVDMVAALGSVPCKLYDFVLQSSLLASSWLIVLVSCERVLVLHFPLRGRLFCSGRHAALAASVTLAIIVASQVFRIFFADQLLVNTGDTGNHNDGARCFLDLNLSFLMIPYAFAEFFVLYFTPNVLILVFNVAVIRKIESVAVSVRAVPNARGVAGGLECSLKRKRSRATIILVCIALIYLLTNLPVTAEHAIFYMSYYMGPKPQLEVEDVIMPNGGFILDQNLTTISSVSTKSDNQNIESQPSQAGAVHASNGTAHCFEVDGLWSVRVTMFIAEWHWLLVDPWVVLSYATSFYTYALLGKKFRRQVSLILKETASRIVSKFNVLRLFNRRLTAVSSDDAIPVENQNMHLYIPQRYCLQPVHNGEFSGNSRRRRSHEAKRSVVCKPFPNSRLQPSVIRGNIIAHLPDSNLCATAARNDEHDIVSCRRANPLLDIRNLNPVANGCENGICSVRTARYDRLLLPAIGNNYMCMQHVQLLNNNRQWEAIHWFYNRVASTNQFSPHKISRL